MADSLAILNLLEFKFLRAYHSLKPHILFYSNGLAIWQSLPDIRNIKIIKAILAERFKQDKGHNGNRQKAYLHPVCFQNLLQKRKYGQTDGWTYRYLGRRQNPWAGIKNSKSYRLIKHLIVDQKQ